MSNIHIDDLSTDLELGDMTGIRGGIWDYVNRLGVVGEHIKASRTPPTIGDRGISIEDAANAGDDSGYYPGLTPLR